MNDNVLNWPAHFPPTDPWKRFFIGVRKLGPDLSFFKELKLQQNLRTEESMRDWGTSVHRLEIATTLSRIIQEYAGWPKPFFLPKDSFATITYGPTLLEAEEHPIEDIICKAERLLSRHFDEHFWQTALTKTFGEVVDTIENGA